MNTITNSFRKVLVLGFAALTGMLGVNGGLWAAECAFDSVFPEPYGARYVLRVDAGTTCAEMGMVGCDPVVGGTGKCEASGMNVDFTVAADGSLSWTSFNPANHPDAIIVRGGTQGNGCGYFNPDEYDQGDGLGDLNNKDAYTGIKSAQACTDNTRNPVSQAILQISKRATDADGDCMSAGEILNVAITDPSVGVGVKYCYALSNIGGGEAVVDVVLDDNGNGYVDECPSSGCGVYDDFSPFDVPMTLRPGETVYAESDPAVTVISDAGTITNVVRASGTWTDPLDTSIVVDLYAEDTATVVARKSIEPCPKDPQDIMDGTFSTEDGYNFGFFLDSNNPNRSAMCVPSAVKTKGVECENECLPRDCSDPADCAITPCEPSGVWNADYNPGDAERLPYCWEVAMDRNRDGVYQRLAPVKQDQLTIIRRNENPYTGTYCYSSGGREVCRDYCYPKTGEPDSVCN